MTTAVQRRRGTSTEHSTFTGLDGEITVNTTTYTLHIHDGATVGGVALAKADGSNLVTSSIDINGGTIDGTVIGGSSAAAGTFTTLTASGEITANGGIALGDGDKATFGDGDDLQIFHNGTHSYIQDSGTGNLRIDGADIQLRDISTGDSYFLGQQSSGEVRLYHSGSNKLTTTATGIDVTGTVTADGLVVSNAGANADIIITEGGTNTDARIRNSNGILQIGADINDEFGASEIQFSVDGKEFISLDRNGSISFFEDTGTTAKFFWDASAESLGIGTSPAELLHVHEDSTNVARIRLSNTDGYLEIGTNNQVSNLDSQTHTFRNEAGSTEYMRIDSSGNVGIGTSSPTDNLSVGTLGSGSNSIITIGASTTGTSSIYFGDGASAARFRGYFDYVHSSDHLAIGTAGAERMRIDSSGNLLVGKTASGTDVGGEIRSNGKGYFRVEGSDAGLFDRKTSDGDLVIFQKNAVTVGSIGTAGGDLTVGTGDTGLTFEDSADVIHPINQGTGAARDNAIDLGKSAARFKDLYLSGGVRADTLKFENLAGTTEYGRFDASGNLLVGTTTDAGVSGTNAVSIRTTGSRWSRNTTSTAGQINFYNPNGEVGSISTSGSATSYSTSSDQRLKENITDAPAGNIDDIKVRSFDWKADGSHQDYGMVAQELEAVAPYAVTKGETEDDMWSVDYSKLVPMLIKEIQDLKAEVAVLKGAN